MFKAKGMLDILNDGKMREIQVSNGKITGDPVMKFEILAYLKDMEKQGGPVGPAHYFPEKAYTTDELAIVMAISVICYEPELEGDYPELPDLEEGKIG